MLCSRRTDGLNRNWTCKHTQKGFPTYASPSFPNMKYPVVPPNTPRGESIDFPYANASAQCQRVSGVKHDE